MKLVATKLILVLLSVTLLGNTVVVNRTATTTEAEEPESATESKTEYEFESETKPAIVQATETEQPATEIETESEFEPETEPATELASEAEIVTTSEVAYSGESYCKKGSEIIPTSPDLEVIYSTRIDPLDSQVHFGTKVGTEVLKEFQELTFTETSELDLNYQWQLCLISRNGEEEKRIIIYVSSNGLPIIETKYDEAILKLMREKGLTFENLIVNVSKLQVVDNNGQYYVADGLNIDVQLNKLEDVTESETEVATEPVPETEPETEAVIFGDEIITENVTRGIASRYVNPFSNTEISYGTEIKISVLKDIRKIGFTKGEYDSYTWKIYLPEEETTIFFNGTFPTALNDFSCEEMIKQFVAGRNGYSVIEDNTVKVTEIVILTSDGSSFKATNLDLTIQVEKVEDEAETELETPGHVIIPESALKVAARNAERFGTRVTTTHAPLNKSTSSED